MLDAFVAKNRMRHHDGQHALQALSAEHALGAKGATNKEDMRRFNELTGYFKKYATQYDFDWLLLAAQGYQESGLDQSTRSPVGAIGVMQVMPTTAGDKNVAIKDIHSSSPTSRRASSTCASWSNQYFDEPGIDRVNRHLFAFAAYNAGPTASRDCAARPRPRGWTRTSGSTTSSLVAEDVGRETVQYVSNIYKYYIAYKLTLDRAQKRESAKPKAAAN